jgi:hypothetical protein
MLSQKLTFWESFSYVFFIFLFSCFVICGRVRLSQNVSFWNSFLKDLLFTSFPQAAIRRLGRIKEIAVDFGLPPPAHGLSKFRFPAPIPMLLCLSGAAGASLGGPAVRTLSITGGRAPWSSARRLVCPLRRKKNESVDDRSWHET